MLSNRPDAARIGVNVTGLGELQNGSFKVNTWDSNYANFKTCIYLWTMLVPKILFND